jgi:hypothetical protein
LEAINGGAGLQHLWLLYLLDASSGIFAIPRQFGLWC